MSTLTKVLPVPAQPRVPSVRLSREGARTVVWLRGDHDVATELLVADSLAAASAADDGDVVVDLSEADFIGGSTVDLLLRGQAFLQARSRALSLRAPSRSARRIIEIRGLSALIDPVWAGVDIRLVAG